MHESFLSWVLTQIEILANFFMKNKKAPMIIIEQNIRKKAQSAFEPAN